MKASDNKLRKYFRKDPKAFYKDKNGQWRCRSVHFGDDFRFNKAKEEAQKDPAPVAQVIQYVNEFLSGIGVAPVLNPIRNPAEISYSEIKKQYDLNDERDLIWIKFTRDGYVGVVAQSNDVNFQLPISADDYNKKENGRWQFNTSGIIIHSLGKSWDTTKVLVFPLQLNNINYSRHEIETAVGNFFNR